MPSLKRHVRQVIRNHYRVAVVLLAIGGILLAVGYQMAAPALGWASGHREKLEFVHLMLPLMGLGFVLGAVVALARAVRLAGRPDRNPVLRRLAVHGPPPDVLAEIDAELAGDDVVTIGRPLKSFRLASSGAGPLLFLTRSWLVQLTELGVHLARLDDV